MTSGHHHREGGTSHERGNGRGVNEQLAREWLHIDGPITWFSLLGIHPLEKDPQRIQDAVVEREALLAPHLQDEGERGEARRIAREIERIAQILLTDSARRKRYTRELLRQYPELLVSTRQRETHDAIVERRVTPPGTLQRMAGWVKRNPVVTAVSAGVLALSTTLFVATRPRGETEESTEVPASAPEFPGEESATTSVPPAPLTPEPTPPPIEKPAPPAEAAAEPPPPVPPEPATPPPSPAPVEAAAVPPAKAEESVEAPPVRPVKRKPVPAIEWDEVRKLEEGQTTRKKTVKILLEEARQVSSDTERWTLFIIAERKARATCDLDTVAATLAEMGRYFEADPLLLNEKTAAVREAAGDREAEVALVMRHVCGVARDHCDRAEFAEAQKFLAQLQNRPSVNRRQLTEITRFVKQLAATFHRQKIAERLETLQDSPDDPEANRVVGEYHCLERGDWSKTAFLGKSEDALLRDLATRADRRATMTAQELLEFAQEIVTRKGEKPGEAALALECCELGLKQAPSPLVATRLSDLKLELLRRHGAALSLASHSAESSPSPDVATSAPLAGSVNLLPDSPKDLLARSHIVRAEWKGAAAEDQTVLTGKSGHYSWVSCIHVPLTAESMKILHAGQPIKYTVTFSRSPEGRRADESQGATAFLIPLPTGRHVGILFDANMDHLFWKNGAGLRRSGFYTADRYFFDARPAASPQSLDHRDPLIKEDGREYVCQIAVTMEGQRLCIIVSLSEKGRDTEPFTLSLVAPATTDACSYLLQEGDKDPLPTGPMAGFGAGGGSITIRDARMAPLTPQRR